MSSSKRRLQRTRSILTYIRTFFLALNASCAHCIRFRCHRYAAGLVAQLHLSSPRQPVFCSRFSMPSQSSQQQPNPCEARTSCPSAHQLHCHPAALSALFHCPLAVSSTPVRGIANSSSWASSLHAILVVAAAAQSTRSAHQLSVGASAPLPLCCIVSIVPLPIGRQQHPGPGHCQ